jgi:hypothetical protein
MIPGLIPPFDPCPQGYVIDTQEVLPDGYLPIPMIATYQAVRRFQNTPLISLCPQMPGVSQCWTTIQIHAFDRLINPNNPVEPPHPSYIIPKRDMGGGAISGQPPASMCKAQVRWVGARNFMGQILIDIGTGVELTIPPATTIEADLLVPWAGDAPAYPHLGELPESWQDGSGNVTPLRGYTYAIGRARHHPYATRGSTGATFTQSVYCDPVVQPIHDLVIPPGARTLQFYRNGEGNAPGYEWLFDPALANDIGDINVGAVTEGHHDVPQNAKMVRINNGQVAAQIVTAVFHLNM